jgi:hypothetical protein
MNERPSAETPQPESDQGKIAQINPSVPAVKSPPDGGAEIPSAAEPVVSKKLTEDEQMALYENDLKDNDWGHQPC